MKEFSKKPLYNENVQQRGYSSREWVVTDRSLVDRFAGIPIQQLDALESALTMFAQARSATPDLSDHARSIVCQALQSAEPAVQAYGYYMDLQDHEGNNPSFFDTSLAIQKINNQGVEYLLRLYDSYHRNIGEQPEVLLAQHLGIERGLQGKYVQVSLGEASEPARVDLAEFIGRLQPLLSTFHRPIGQDSQRLFPQRGSAGSAASIRPQEIVQHLLAPEYRYLGHPAFELGERDGAQLTLGVANMGASVPWLRGVDAGASLWRAEGEGTILAGLRSPAALEIAITPRTPNRERVFAGSVAVAAHLKRSMETIATEVITALSSEGT